MRTVITGLLKGRIIRWSIAAAVLAAAGLSVAWLGPVHYRLGGGFIGSPVNSGGLYWSAYQAPLDSAGQTAALRVNVYSYSEAAAGLLAYSGADTLTEGIGQLAMVSNDTAKGSLVFYGLKQGNPPQIKQIWTWDGTTTFTSPDTYEVGGMMNIYAADADADGDGRPDPGAVPLFPVPAQYAVTRVLP
jgi:hypothetical protein